jgi:hypothetical protein
MKLKEILSDNSLNERLLYVKFKYDNFKQDPRPRVKVLDFEYPGQENQKSYGQRKDLLGWNINYFSNKKQAREAIDDIADFARLLAANKLEMYQRIRDLFPEQAQYLRRYNRDFVKGIKERKGILWRRADLNDLTKREPDIF